MKKKAYMHPEMEVIEIKNHQVLLTGSERGLGGDYPSGGQVLAPGFDLESILFG